MKKNREIKFRVWNVPQGKMMYNPTLPIGWLNDVFKSTGSLYMQYTGLKDKNGKEIYEGDIVEHENIELKTGDRYKIKGKVVFEKAGFSIKAFFDGRGTGLMDYSLLYPNPTGKIRWKVIGNIYENKELLK